MKKGLSILFIGLSVLVMLTASAIPHHHHNGVFCTVMEHCPECDSDNGDACPGHHHTDDHSSCVGEAIYLVSAQVDISTIDAASSTALFGEFVPETASSPVLMVPAFSPVVRPEAGWPLHAVDICCAKGLRAPPCPLA